MFDCYIAVACLICLLPSLIHIKSKGKVIPITGLCGLEGG